MGEATRSGRALRATAVFVLSLALGQPATVAVAGGGTVALAADRTTVVAGDAVRFTGSLTAEEACASDRPVVLESRAGGGTWEEAASATTDAGGGFAVVLSPSATAAYRARVPAGAGCPELVSVEVVVEAAARVTLDAPGRVRAGRCPSMEVAVSPPKPGTAVVLERRSGGRWRRVATTVLGARSEARVGACLGFDDIGEVRLRASWPRGDAGNAPGVSRRVVVRVVPARWMERIDARVADADVSIAILDGDLALYRRADGRPRIPASNQKLVLSMALLDALGPDHRSPLRALARSAGPVVRGDLWVAGSGDPEVGRRRLRALARAVAEAGVRRVRGSILGSTVPFGRDWWAPGWRWYFPRDEVALPTALTFEGNEVRGVHVRDPERRAAAFLTEALRRAGVRVRGRPGAGRPPRGLEPVAEVPSRRLIAILAHVDRPSWNFGAEVLGKLLGMTAAGRPGTIAKGAAAIEAWAAGVGVPLRALDASGLSYRNRVSAAGMVRLLAAAEDAPWGAALRRALPGPGQGTLEDRLAGVRVRAKTGTLSGVSALSGWVWREGAGSWARFSILSSGMSKAGAVHLEDAVVRIVSRTA